MSEQVTCGCLTGKACERWAVVERAGTLVWEYLEGYGEQKGYCRHCHAELSFSASGQPVAEAMVPRAALDMVPRLAFEEACQMLSPIHDCPWAHWGDIPCIKGRPMDGPGTCMMSDTDIAECWAIHLEARSDVEGAHELALLMDAERSGEE